MKYENIFACALMFTPKGEAPMLMVSKEDYDLLPNAVRPMWLTIVHNKMLNESMISIGLDDGRVLFGTFPTDIVIKWTSSMRTWHGFFIVNPREPNKHKFIQAHFRVFVQEV